MIIVFKCTHTTDKPRYLYIVDHDCSKLIAKTSYYGCLIKDPLYKAKWATATRVVVAEVSVSSECERLSPHMITVIPENSIWTDFVGKYRGMWSDNKIGPHKSLNFMSSRLKYPITEPIILPRIPLLTSATVLWSWCVCGRHNITWTRTIFHWQRSGKSLVAKYSWWCFSIVVSDRNGHLSMISHIWVVFDCCLCGT